MPIHTIRYFVLIFFITLLVSSLELFATNYLPHIEAEINRLSLPNKEWLEEQTTNLKQLQGQGKFYKYIFQRLKEISNEIKMPCSIGSSKRFKHQNRNTHFLPFDHNRSCREIPNFYISASDITFPLQNYLVAQAPTEKTVRDFWRAILFRGCTLIVTIAMPIENGAHKVYPYWQGDLFPIEIDGWKLELVTTAADDILASLGHINHRIVRRVFRATNAKNQERIITQLHYENWPDGSIPDEKLFSSFLKFVDQHPTNAPIVVHCSAGIGRAGTFVAIHALRKILRQERASGNRRLAISVNIPKFVIALRIQRQRMISSREQFHFIYRMLAREC